MEAISKTAVLEPPAAAVEEAEKAEETEA